MSQTVPYLTKYELSRVIGIRAAQLAHGAPSHVASMPHDRIEQALMELRCRKLHAYILRPIAAFGDKTERVHLNELSFETVPGIPPEFIDPQCDIPMRETIAYSSETKYDVKCKLTTHCVLPPWKAPNSASVLSHLRTTIINKVVVLKPKEVASPKHFGIVCDIIAFETDPDDVRGLDNGCTRMTCHVTAAVQLYQKGETHNVVCTTCTRQGDGFEVEAVQRDCTAVTFHAYSNCCVTPACDLTVRIRDLLRNAKGVLVCNCDNIE